MPGTMIRSPKSARKSVLSRRPGRSTMRRMTGATLALVVGLSGIAVAQDKPMSHMPPKVLAIIREYTKPGKAGTLHEKTESGFIQALTAAKWPTHYIAVELTQRKNQALFLTGYESDRKST